VIVHYVHLAIVPRPLVFLYSWPLETSLAAVWWQAAVLAALSLGSAGCSSARIAGTVAAPSIEPLLNV
jgi:hypothetical protein